MKKLVLRVQQNRILEQIKALMLNPAEFEWVEEPTQLHGKGYVSKLIHKPTQYYFKFDYSSDNNHWAFYSPGEDKAFVSNYTVSWTSQLASVITWLRSLKTEVEAPNLLEGILKEEKLIGKATSDKDSNEPFTLEEKSYLATQLNEIKEYLTKTQKLSAEHAKFVKGRLEYLKEATERLGRKDWLNIAISTFFSIAMTLAFNADKLRDLFRFAAAAIGKVFGAVLQLQ